MDPRDPRLTVTPAVLAPAILALPAAAAGQATAGDTGTPLLWLWIVVAVAVLGAMIVLLFRRGPTRRGPAQAASPPSRRP